jgi:hypothetical protein
MRQDTINEIFKRQKPGFTSMPRHDLPIIAITQTLDNDTYLAEALFFPKVARYAADGNGSDCGVFA